MKISEKQILKLISIVENYGSNLSQSESMADRILSTNIGLLIGEINNQQSDELKDIE